MGRLMRNGPRLQHEIDQGVYGAHDGVGDGHRPRHAASDSRRRDGVKAGDRAPRAQTDAARHLREFKHVVAEEEQH